MTITDDPIPRLENPDDEWLPDSCPRWCDGGHHQCLAEGNGWYESQEHHGRSRGHSLPEIRNEIDCRVIRPGGGRWEVHPRMRPYGPRGDCLDQDTIYLEMDDVGEQRGLSLHLTSGDARVLARQLASPWPMLSTLT